MTSLRPSAGFASVAILLAAGAWAQAQMGLAGASSPLPNRSTAHPAWVDETLEPSGRALVSRVIPGQADVVVLDGGLYQGLRVGVLCNVERAGTPVAELIVVASQLDRSAALITSLGKDAVLAAGDQVRLKTIALP